MARKWFRRRERGIRGGDGAVVRGITQLREEGGSSWWHQLLTDSNNTLPPNHLTFYLASSPAAAHTKERQQQKTVCARGKKKGEDMWQAKLSGWGGWGAFS